MAGHAFQTSAAAAAASRARRIHGHVPELAPEPADTAEQLATDHDPGPDPDLARYEHEVLQVFLRPNQSSPRAARFASLSQ